MTVALSKESQTNFFIKVYGEGWTKDNVEPLIEQGVVINVEFTAISATYQGNYEKVSLSMNTTALLKGANSLMAEDNRKLIQTFIHGLPGKYFSPEVAGNIKSGMYIDPTSFGSSGTAGGGMVVGGMVTGGGGGGSMGGAGGSAASGGMGGAGGSSSFTIKYVPNAPGFHAGGGSSIPHTDMDASQKLSAILKEKLVKAPVAPPVAGIDPSFSLLDEMGKLAGIKPPKATTTKGVIKLRDATKLGQAVQGTSSGSVYTVIALNPRVKVAARVQGTGVSIRAEFDNATTQEIQNLKKFGLSHSGGEHLSMHMQCDDIPVGRVLGAFLLDAGIDFDNQITSLKGMF